MAFGSCFTCFKYSVFLFNFLLWLVGCSMLAVGGWLLTDDNAGRYVEKLTTTTTGDHSPLVINYGQVTESNMATTLAYLFLVFGAMLVLIAFIGCCGAVRDNLCLLSTFSILLSMVFAVLLGVGVWSFVASKKVDAHTTKLQRLTNRTLRDAVPKYYTDPDARSFMDALQLKLRCCGADNAAGDYVRRGSSSQPPCDIAYHQKSCLPVYFDYVAVHFEDFMKDRLVLLATLSVAFALCLVVHMLCLLLLCCAVKERGRSVNV